MDMTRKFNGRLGGIGNGPNFVDHGLCEKVQAKVGDEVPGELVVLAQEVDDLYDEWTTRLSEFHNKASALKSLVVDVMGVILEEDDD